MANLASPLVYDTIIRERALSFAVGTVVVSTRCVSFIYQAVDRLWADIRSFLYFGQRGELSSLQMVELGPRREVTGRIYLETTPVECGDGAVLDQPIPSIHIHCDVN
jgi:hypothetical protein